MKYERSRNDVWMDRESEKFRKLFIRGLDYKTTEDTLKSHFEQWGEIVDVAVMRDPKTKSSGGFGFVTYSKAAMVDAAQERRPHKIDGREVEAKRAVPRQLIDKPEAGDTVKKVFIGGLNKDVEDKDLRDYFEKYGTITDAAVGKTDISGIYCGFVEFDDYDPVDKIILEGNHYLKNRKVNVLTMREKADQKQKQERSTTGGRGDWDGPGANEKPGWNQGSAGGGGYDQGSAGSSGVGYGRGAPAPETMDTIEIREVANREVSIMVEDVLDRAASSEERAPGAQRDWWTRIIELATAMRPQNCCPCCPIQPEFQPWPARSVAIMILITVVLVFLIYFTGFFSGYSPFN